MEQVADAVENLRNNFGNLCFCTKSLVFINKICLVWQNTLVIFLTPRIWVFLSMYSKEALCSKITALYPDIGKCGIDITVEHDPKKKGIVNLI